MLAFTDFGIETPIELIKIHKDNPTLLSVEIRKSLPGGLRRMATLSTAVFGFLSRAAQPHRWASPEIVLHGLSENDEGRDDVVLAFVKASLSLADVKGLETTGTPGNSASTPVEP